MKARLLIDSIGHRHGPDGRSHVLTKLPAGTTIDHPDAYLLVRQGQAEAADDECAARIGMTPEQLATAQEHYKMATLGIAPEDYDAYQAGYMTGYDGDGNWIPGPNYEAWLNQQETADDDQ